MTDTDATAVQPSVPPPPEPVEWVNEGTPKAAPSRRRTPWTAIMVMIVLVVAIATAGITYAVVDDGPEVNRLEDRLEASRNINGDLRDEIDGLEDDLDDARADARAAEAEVSRQYDAGWSDGYDLGVVDGGDAMAAAALQPILPFVSDAALYDAWLNAAPGSQFEQALEDEMLARGTFPGDV